MGSTCVVGLQWGDEAKGKIVDLLCDQHDVVVRYQGGANAGHTVVHEGVTYKLSLVPTGILRPGIECVIGNGVVIHPPALLKEIETLASQGVEPAGRLHISDRAHVILPYHLAEERLTEESADVADHSARPDGGSARAIATRSAGCTASASAICTTRSRFASDWPGSSTTRTDCSAAMLPDFMPFDHAGRRRGIPRVRRATPAVRRRHDGLAAPGGRRAVGCCSKGRRARSWTSIMAAIPT